MENNLNVDPHSIYRERYEELDEFIMTKLGGDVSETKLEELFNKIDSVLDEMWNGQRTELFLQCLNAQLDEPEVKLNEAMAKIFKGNHSKITIERPRGYVNPNPVPKPVPAASARKWMG